MSAPPPTVAAAIRGPAPPTAPSAYSCAPATTSWTFAAAYARGVPVRQPVPRPARRRRRPFHVGVLMDNLPAFVFAELGCALAGAALVGLNPTRTGERAGARRRIRRLSAGAGRAALRRAAAEALGDRAPPVLDVDGRDPRWPELERRARTAVRPPIPQIAVEPVDAAHDRLHLRHHARARKAC